MDALRYRRKLLALQLGLAVCIAGLGRAGLAQAQTCLGVADMDEAARTALVSTGKRYFDLAARGDATALRQNAIASVASDFSGIEASIKDNQSDLAGAQATSRAPYLLKAEGTAPVERAEFLCGVFGTHGQTTDSAVFVLNNLPPGNYGIVILDVAAAKSPMTLSLVLQQQGSDWKLGGFYVKAAQAAGHDGNWFADRARAFKAKAQMHNAWLYFFEARDLLSPLPFMNTMVTDKLFDESESVKPSDLPPTDLSAGGKTFKLTSLFPQGVGKDFAVVVKYQASDISNTTQSYETNLTLTKALVAKYPEFRDAFDGVVARAVDPSGRDYGSLVAMKDIK